MSTIKCTTIQNLSGVEVYTCKAWVNFNGTGTVAIRASGNVSSITDNGTGDYTVNFTNSMVDANYSTVIDRETLAASSYGFAGTVLGSKNSSACRINTLTTAGTGSDLSNISLSVFR